MKTVARFGIDEFIMWSRAGFETGDVRITMVALREEMGSKECL